MTTAMKSVVLLAFTLIVGFALGLFADAMLVRNRRERIAGMGRPPGIVDHLQQVIQPKDSAQASKIRPILQRTIDANQLIIQQTNERVRANMDSMRVSLDSTLDSGQRDRLARELRRMPQIRGPGEPGGRGRGGRGRRGGPSGPPPT